MGTVRSVEGTTANETLQVLSRARGFCTATGRAARSQRPRLRDGIERRLCLGALQELERYRVNGVGLRRICGGGYGFCFLTNAVSSANHPPRFPPSPPR